MCLVRCQDECVCFLKQNAPRDLLGRRETGGKTADVGRAQLQLRRQSIFSQGHFSTAGKTRGGAGLFQELKSGCASKNTPHRESRPPFLRGPLRCTQHNYISYYIFEFLSDCVLGVPQSGVPRTHSPRRGCATLVRHHGELRESVGCSWVLCQHCSAACGRPSAGLQLSVGV